MKHVYKSLVLAVAVAMVGCQKAPTETRIGSNANRSGVATAGATTTSDGVSLSGLVTTDAQYQDQFQNEVDDFLEGSIDPENVGTVSATGANQTGVFVGGKVLFVSGQPYSSTMAGTQSITADSKLLVAVYDRFADVANLAPIPPVYLTQATGTVSGTQVNLKFWDSYGSVTLTGMIQGSVTVLKFEFSTDRKWDLSGPGHAGQLGDLRIPTCQFFRCQ